MAEEWRGVRRKTLHYSSAFYPPSTTIPKPYQERIILAWECRLVEVVTRCNRFTVPGLRITCQELKSRDMSLL